FDEDGAFVTRCNREMVALETLEGDEAEVVRHLIEEHAMRTGSPKAHELLDGWNAVKQKIVKVLPSEYKRILAEKATMPETAGRPGPAPRGATPASQTNRVPTFRRARGSGRRCGGSRMGKLRGFVEIKRKKSSSRPIAERLQDWREFDIDLPEPELRDQAARC